jgi:hypothetical protein
LRHGGERQGEGLEISVAFREAGIVALEAVFPEELLDDGGGIGGWFVRGRLSRGRFGRFDGGREERARGEKDCREPGFSPAPSYRNSHAKEPVLDPKESVSTPMRRAIST